jgi:glycosyltransferase involved in cell wall biosynthesis
MATYNGGKYLTEQISSILQQIGDYDELVISDDGSTDDTIDIAKSFEDSRIKIYVGNYKNVIKNFENALTNASGDIIFLADQDDIWMPGKVSRTLGCLETYDLVVSDSYIVDEDLQLLYGSFFDLLKSGKGIYKNIIKSTYFGSCMSFRKSVLDAALPFPDTKEIGHDLWLGLVAEMIGRVFFLKEPLIKYRRHDAAFTNVGTGKNSRSLFVKIKGRIIMIREVIKFYSKYRLCKRD